MSLESLREGREGPCNVSLSFILSPEIHIIREIKTLMIRDLRRRVCECQNPDNPQPA